jgi:hypothetical protein
MADPISIAISLLALGVSTLTAWLTLFRRGTVIMTRPTVVFFGPDVPRSHGELALPKVFLRTLLFATSKRGRIIESMHITLSRSETRQNFNIWVYGDKKLVRGSGLFVGETGVAANHHFLVPNDATTFRFTEGRYKLDVFAHLLGDRQQKLLFAEVFEITPKEATALIDSGGPRYSTAGIYFDWGPDSSRYLSHVESRAPAQRSGEISELLQSFYESEDEEK